MESGTSTRALSSTLQGQEGWEGREVRVSNTGNGHAPRVKWQLQCGIPNTTPMPGASMRLASLRGQAAVGIPSQHTERQELVLAQAGMGGAGVWGWEAAQ